MSDKVCEICDGTGWAMDYEECERMFAPMPNGKSPPDPEPCSECAEGDARREELRRAW